MAYQRGYPIVSENGTYVRYCDTSGAELWIQLNASNEFIGMNPHFFGKSRRRAALIQKIEKEHVDLDGAFLAWALEDDKDFKDKKGLFPFVFDLPDFDTIIDLTLPKIFELQLVGFAMNFDCFDNSEIYYQFIGEKEYHFSDKAFIPVGIIQDNSLRNDLNTNAVGLLSGEILELLESKNELTNEKYYWLLVDTLGGEIDILVNKKYITNTPTVGNIILAQCWLSGRIVNAPLKFEKGGILPKMMGDEVIKISDV